MNQGPGFTFDRGYYLLLQHDEWKDDSLAMLEKLMGEPCPHWSSPRTKIDVICKGKYDKRRKDNCFLRKLNEVHVKTLRFEKCELDILDALEEGVQGMTIDNLQMIVVQNLTFPQWRQLIRIMGKLKVKKFEFYATEITMPMVDYLCRQLKGELSGLKVLFWFNSSIDNNKGVKHIVRNLSGTKLTLINWNWLHIQDLPMLASTLIDTKLVELDFKNIFLSAEGYVGEVATIIRNNSFVEKIDFSSCRLDFEQSIPILDACLDSLHLVELRLYFNRWGNREKEIAARKFCCHPTLKILQMYDGGRLDNGLPLYMRIWDMAHSEKTRVFVILCSLWSCPRLKQASNPLSKFVGSNIRLLYAYL